MESQSYFREVSKENGEKCYIPKYQDYIYNQYKKQEKENTYFMKECEQEGASVDVVYAGNLTYQSIDGIREFCYPDLLMRVMGKGGNGACAIRSDCVSFSDCYCENEQHKLPKNTTMKCLCEMRLLEGPCEPYRFVSNFKYTQQNCLLNGTDSSGRPSIINCTIKSNSFPSENSYFDELYTSEGISMGRLSSRSNPLKNTLAINPLVPLLLLIFHLFLYFRLFRKEL